MVYNKDKIITRIPRRVIAERYFKSPKPDSSVRRMRRWLLDDRALLHDLIEVGYHDRQRVFTREQIAVFEKYFGEE